LWAPVAGGDEDDARTGVSPGADRSNLAGCVDDRQLIQRLAVRVPEHTVKLLLRGTAWMFSLTNHKQIVKTRTPYFDGIAMLSVVKYD
jgi:hypothetical protein